MYNRPLIRLAPLGTFPPVWGRPAMSGRCGTGSCRMIFSDTLLFWNHSAFLHSAFLHSAFCIFYPPRSRMAPQGRTMQIIYP